jgi:predicted 3-demethylubiquinone-9 3-methyltransferase (glyoxalase superfamily)
MNNQIYPCLWFDGKAREAATFYCSVFSAGPGGEDSKITADNPMVVTFELAGKKFMGLNGGPMFTINPSISMFVTCSSNNEIVNYWNKLSEGGSPLMQLDKYPWSEKYGWIKDKFGMTWQLMMGDVAQTGQKINTSFLFANEQYGKAREAIELYTSIFPSAKIHHQELYKAGEGQPEGYLKFGHFTLNNEIFAAMDGPGDHQFNFGEGLSIVVNCDTQEEIDRYWDKLTSNGGTESQCGWLKDKFGVSWQIVPTVLGKLMSDPEKSPRVIQAFMKMKKFNIEALLNA